MAKLKAVAEIIPGGDFPVVSAENVQYGEKRLSEYLIGSIITPESYGAVGDGTTDCTVAINKCLRENPNSTIRFGSGIYLISDTLHAYGNIGGQTIIVGGATIKWKSSASRIKPMIDCNLSAGQEGRCTIVNGTFDGNNTAAYGVVLDSFHARITGSKIIDCTKAQLVVGDLAEDGTAVKSLQAFVENLYIFTTAASGAAWSNSDRVGILVNEDDNFFSNVNVYRMNKAIVLRAHGNEFSNCHLTCDYKTPLADPYDAYAVYVQPFSGRANLTNADDFSTIYFDNYKYCFGASEVNRTSLNVNSSHYFYSGKATTNAKVYCFIADKFTSYLSCDDMAVITSDQCCFLDFYCNGSTDPIRHGYSRQKYIRDINNPYTAYQTILAKNRVDSGEYVQCLYAGRTTEPGKVYEIASILSAGTGLSNIPEITIKYANRIYGHHEWKILRKEDNSGWDILDEISDVASQLGDFYIHNPGNEITINGTVYTEYKLLFVAKFDGYWGDGYISFEFAPTVAVYVNYSRVFELASANLRYYTKLSLSSIPVDGIADNLIPTPFEDVSGVVRENATFTYDSDGVITINKSEEGEKTAYFTLYNALNTIGLVEGEKYTLSISAVSGTGTVSAYYASRVVREDEEENIDLAATRDVDAGNRKSATFVYRKEQGYITDRIGIYVAKNAVCNQLKVKVSLEKGNKSHEYQPYALSRTSFRKDIDNKVDNSEYIAENIIPFPYSDASGTVQRGVTVEYKDDGIVHVYGTVQSDKDAYIILSNRKLQLENGKDYTMSIEISGDAGNSSFNTMILRSVYPEGNEDLATLILKEEPSTVTFKYLERSGLEAQQLLISVRRSQTVDFFVKPMLEKGAVAHAYQPYILSRKALRDDIDAIIALSE